MLKWESKDLYTRKNIIVLLISYLLFILNIVSVDCEQTCLDMIVSLFMGVSVEGFSFVDFLRLIYINIIPIYIIAGYMQKKLVEQNIIVKIRTTPLYDFVCKLILIAKFLGIYIGIYMVCILAICFFQEREMDRLVFYADVFYLNPMPIRMCLGIMCLRYIELFIAVLIVWFFSLRFSNSIIGLCIYLFSGIAYFLRIEGSFLGFSSGAQFAFLEEKTMRSLQQSGLMGCVCALILIFIIGKLSAGRKKYGKNY